MKKHFLVLLCIALAGGPVPGAEIIMKTRDRYVGEIVEKRLDYIRLKTPDGIQEIEREKIDKIITTEYLKRQYSRKLKGLGQDPSSERLEILANWCNRKGLWLERDALLSRIGKPAKAEEAPDKVTASPTSKSKPAPAVKHRTESPGRYKWLVRFRNMGGDYRKAKKDEARRAIETQLMKIDDPLAEKAFLRMLDARQETVRELFVKIVAARKMPGAAQRMAQLYVEDGVETIRQHALSCLGDIGNEAAVNYLIKRLSNRFYRAETTSRAARGLAEIGHPKAVDKLIDVLVIQGPAEPDRKAVARFNYVKTNYVKRVGVAVAKGVAAPRPIIGSTESGASVQRSISSAFGVKEVYEALVQCTGQDFEYNQNEWQRWWKENRRGYLRDYKKQHAKTQK